VRKDVPTRNKIIIILQIRYHAHSDVQRADGLYGAFVVHKPAVSGSSEKAIFEYNADLALMVGDWYHRSAQEVQDYYTEATNFGLEVSSMRPMQ